MTRYRVDAVVVANLQGMPRIGRVVELDGPWWDRWYGVQFKSTYGNTITCYYKKRNLIRLTSS